jgi:hypothetical protein
VYPEDAADPSRFFGEAERSRKANWKVRQLCKQVERAAAVTLASVCEGDALLGASVAAVEPAPDPGRLLVTVVLEASKGADAATDARVELLRRAAAFRGEVARSVHRKRVPELVFDVSLATETTRG